MGQLQQCRIERRRHARWITSTSDGTQQNDLILISHRLSATINQRRAPYPRLSSSSDFH
jgi:hypothetical protein